MSKNLKTGIFAFIILALCMTGCSAFSSYRSIYDKNVGYNADFKQLLNDRSSSYDNIMKTVRQKGSVAKANDTSFQLVVASMIKGQTLQSSNNVDNIQRSNPAMIYLMQANPTASFSEVSKMYQDLSRQIEGDRKTIVEKERKIGLLVSEQEKLLNGFWASFFFKNEVRLSTLYKPITSSAMEEINRTGKDDNEKVF